MGLYVQVGRTASQGQARPKFRRSSLPVRDSHHGQRLGGVATPCVPETPQKHPAWHRGLKKPLGAGAASVPQVQNCPTATCALPWPSRIRAANRAPLDRGGFYRPNTVWSRLPYRVFGRLFVRRQAPTLSSSPRRRGSRVLISGCANRSGSPPSRGRRKGDGLGLHTSSSTLSPSRDQPEPRNPRRLPREGGDPEC